MSSDSLNLKFKVLTPSRWKDLEKLFGGCGACGGCWCMWWKLSRKDFEKQKGIKNKKAFKKIVSNGERPGILTYYKNEPIGWCAAAPRDKYPLLENSRVLRKIDDEQVWSIVCFFIEKSYRRKGITVELLKAAVDYVKKSGGKIVEAYPVDVKNKKSPDAFVWTGIASTFLKASFKEVVRRSSTRPIVRYYIGQ